jgi:hypothetical protein
MNDFNNLNEARTLTRQWEEHYNTQRPQAALGKMTPQEFARSFWALRFRLVTLGHTCGPKTRDNPITL